MKKLFSLFLILLYLPVMAQINTADADVEMADKFRADGKIYVVILVVGIILTGIFTYLFILDRKISQIEKEIDSK